MSNSLVKSSAVARDAKVSNCVSELIQAFANGLNIFKRLRERRKKRKHHKHHKHKGQETKDPAANAELQLSNSLRRAPADIQASYENHYSKAGDRFAKGDAIAHASLAETLIKLNTGLVGIIAAFLNNDSKNHHLNLDYKSLTNLSEASRNDAIQSLSSLYQRLSQSQLQVYRIGGCAQCGSMKHLSCSGAVARRTSSSKERQSDEKKKSGSRSRSTGPTVTRLPIKGTGQTQLVMVRPQGTRPQSTRSSRTNSTSCSNSSNSNSSNSSNSSRTNSTSCSSSSSTKSPPSPLSSPQMTPIGSPLPAYAPVDPLALPKLPISKAGRQRLTSPAEDPRPPAWPYVNPADVMPLQLPPPKLPRSRGAPPLIREKEASFPSPTEPHPAFASAIPPAMRRRLDKTTPSTYTFASDSTKLGEIPQRKWTTPWDQDEAQRLNVEAMANAAHAAAAAANARSGDKARQKKGVFKFLRRGSMSQQ
ncbi:hypothetical protein BS50DRAFT_649708 [Corynespora cassiicola Philippines]|uniref:Uncharacterized protein n=1 Tax=Corynespora cassiicola Philippines TaxID=1448308 RepID=A0A2T2NAZ5_CORCC|nr:hypothetical protein BS50DRAFT_649708 [Corynespora cassiicola Philippines]